MMHHPLLRFDQIIEHQPIGFPLRPVAHFLAQRQIFLADLVYGAIGNRHGGQIADAANKLLVEAFLHDDLANIVFQQRLLQMENIARNMRYRRFAGRHFADRQGESILIVHNSRQINAGAFVKQLVDHRAGRHDLDHIALDQSLR